MFRPVATLLSLLLFMVMVGIAGTGFVFWRYGRDLPDVQQLAVYEPPVTTRLYAGDGQLLAEYAKEKRTFVPLTAMPQRVVAAFLSAEDKNFYNHSGLDPVGMARALVGDLQHLGGGRRPAGASTITQQVARNFLLNDEVSITRKIKEAILAMRIEQAFTKSHILELYLNQIYLGRGSYGVAAAALNYFDKSLDELTIAECAYLASLPKSPSGYDPVRDHQKALDRRHYVIGRLLEDGHISKQDADTADAEPLVAKSRYTPSAVHNSEYFSEEVRRTIIDHYGEEALGKGGLAVRTTVDPTYQDAATQSLRLALSSYDMRHGWRGPVTHVELANDWAPALAHIARPAAALETWQVAIVLHSAVNAEIGFASGQRAVIPFAQLSWARPWLEKQHVGAAPRTAADVLKPGDIVLVEPVSDAPPPPPPSKSKKGAAPVASPAPVPVDPKTAKTFALRQIPDVNGAMVVLDPNTGRILALVGGWSYQGSVFNRATQGMRQPGSSFKPFVYLTAFENGLNPSTLALDAPFEFDQGPGLPLWKPKNYEGDYIGAATLRRAVEASRNLMTVRVALAVGMDKIAKTARDFGIDPKFPAFLADSIGSDVSTLLRMVTAYGMLDNGGRRITPTLIDRIQDRDGKTILAFDNRPCDGCKNVPWTNQAMPDLPDQREQVADPLSIYQIVHVMEGVVQHGTAAKLASLGIPLAGKTGTTNESKDTWFIGFTPDLVVGAVVGFDEPRSLGPREQGSSVALPAVEAFLKATIKDKPIRPFPVPPGIQLVRVSHATGLLAKPGDSDVILEAFKPGQLPGDTPGSVIDGSAHVESADGGTTHTSAPPLTNDGFLSEEGVMTPDASPDAAAAAAAAAPEQIPAQAPAAAPITRTTPNTAPPAPVITPPSSIATAPTVAPPPSMPTAMPGTAAPAMMPVPPPAAPTAVIPPAAEPQPTAPTPPKSDPAKAEAGGLY